MSKPKRGGKLPAFTAMLHHVMDSPAFAALSPLAQCVYWRLKRKAGPHGARNGSTFYGVREAAEDMRVNKDSAMRAFWELQAKGFIRPSTIGHLGITGEGNATTWQLTEFPPVTGGIATKDFLHWAEGNDFPVVKGRSPRRKKQNPVLNSRTACPKFSDVGQVTDTETGGSCPKFSDVQANIEALPVLRIRTPKELPPKGGSAVSLPARAGGVR